MMSFISLISFALHLIVTFNTGGRWAPTVCPSLAFDCKSMCPSQTSGEVASHLSDYVNFFLLEQILQGTGSFQNVLAVDQLLSISDSTLTGLAWRAVPAFITLMTCWISLHVFWPAARVCNLSAHTVSAKRFSKQACVYKLQKNLTKTSRNCCTSASIYVKHAFAVWLSLVFKCAFMHLRGENTSVIICEKQVLLPTNYRRVYEVISKQ